MTDKDTTPPNKITCITCGKTDVPDWNGRGQCITCARDAVLGTDLSELREKLAAIEHERWADWQRWCHKVLRENNPSPEQGDILERWDRQIETPYDQLSEKEKDSDREQVDRYLPLITLYAKQYAQPPVVADEELDETLDKILDKLTENDRYRQPKDLAEAKAALLQREQRLVAEAQYKLANSITTDKGDAYYQGIPLEHYAKQLNAQLRHNTNTGKDE